MLERNEVHGREIRELKDRILKFLKAFSDTRGLPLKYGAVSRLFSYKAKSLCGPDGMRDIITSMHYAGELYYILGQNGNGVLFDKSANPDNDPMIFENMHTVADQFTKRQRDKDSNRSKRRKAMEHEDELIEHAQGIAQWKSEQRGKLSDTD